MNRAFRLMNPLLVNHWICVLTRQTNIILLVSFSTLVVPGSFNARDWPVSKRREQLQLINRLLMGMGGRTDAE